ncbi:MAG: HAD-IA family hydrolase [Bacilli bacterium]|nr:HAD-IA family hydrolase [Bacilli bacterium]
MRNIIFDLGGVILKDKPISILNCLNIDNKRYNLLKIFFYDWKKLDLGEETLEDKYKQCNFPKEYDDLYKNLLINYYKYREIDMRLINCINKLKNNGYNIYILSDNNKECFEYYKSNSIFKNIDGWTLSCDYHTSKGDGQLFDICIKKFNLNPSECYFIDDKLSNIEEAKKHGINGSTFNTSEDIAKLYNDMRNNEINI